VLKFEIMEILKPQLIWIGKRCYRKNPLKNNSGFNPEDEILDDDGERDYQQDLTYCDEICDAGLNVEETAKGFRLVMPVPSLFYKYIIGKKGETKKKIETETRTQILVPKPGEQREEITIQGHDKKGIISAKTRLDVIVDSARQRAQFTHFLSIPVNTEEIVSSFEDFRFEVLNKCDGDRGLDASIFQAPAKLHLTLGTMVLLNEAELAQVHDALQDCQDNIIQPLTQGKRLEVKIRGLEYMNDDPREVDVLYAKVQDDCAGDRLQALVDRLTERLSRSGVMQANHGEGRVKLHVTVMNTLFRKDPSAASLPQTESTGPAGGRGRSDRESFDASQVLKKFGDFNFGPLHVSSIQLSQRYSTGEDGYYASAGSLTLPG